MPQSIHEPSETKVAIIGGGLVGALEACLMVKRGFDVTLFESRHDGRNEPNYYGRSINLAISHRGISALELVNLKHLVAKLAIPMKARMIHDEKGKLAEIPYDRDGRCINSIERSVLNNYLLNEAERRNVKLQFGYMLVDMNPKNCELTFRLRNQDGSFKDEIASQKFDMVFGCDGAKSNVRAMMSRFSKVETSQTYIDHCYIELRMDADKEGNHRMSVNYLHIWPRGQFMMIALPNKDGSFTCTLFISPNILSSLNAEARLDFFEQTFPDALKLIGRQQVYDTLANCQLLPLISVKCNPYHYQDKIVLLGDAAHAMVPFYGQGMNCGFEDCAVLDELFDAMSKYDTNGQCTYDIKSTFEMYSQMRCKNGSAMCELAMYNYIEMRDHVTSIWYHLRRRLDNFLYRRVTYSWMPLYTMVTFTRIPIDECLRRKKRQDECIQNFGKSLLIGIILSGLAASLYFFGDCKISR